MSLRVSDKHGILVRRNRLPTILRTSTSYNATLRRRRGGRAESKRTLDIHECAQLDLTGVMILTMDAAGTEHEVQQRTVVDPFDFSSRPVMSY